jgi:hypothetical protein
MTWIGIVVLSIALNTMALDIDHLPNGHCLKQCGQVWCNGGTDETRFCYPTDVWQDLIDDDPERTGVLLRHLCPTSSPPCAQTVSDETTAYRLHVLALVIGVGFIIAVFILDRHIKTTYRWRA